MRGEALRKEEIKRRTPHPLLSRLLYTPCQTTPLGVVLEVEFDSLERNGKPLLLYQLTVPMSSTNI